MEVSRRSENEPQAADDSAERKPAGAKLPDRYSIRSKAEYRELVCNESPNMAVRIERGKTTPSGAARKAPSGTIFLDGAAEGGPFLDVERAVFNLDHHEGCVRSFTLATCEQAMVVVCKGLDLQKRDWTIHANDPDLDTVFAIWVLLNHMRLSDTDPEIRKKVMPLLRLQGTIDAHGLEMQELCGFPPELQQSIFATLEQLRNNEATLRKDGKWQEIDFLEYTVDVLCAIDRLVYSSHHFDEVLLVEELARAEIGDGQLAIVFRGEPEIYHLERYLRRLHGKRLGVIILQKDSRTYTLRQVDSFLPATLNGVYDLLNLIDSAAGNRRSGNRWGGSAEIGGSPRATGTELTPQQIADAFARTYRRTTKAQRLGALGIAIFECAAVMAGSMTATYLQGWLRDPAAAIEDYFRNQTGTYAAVLSALSAILILAAIRRGRKLFGLCMPAGFDWLALLPGALLAGAAGGAWISAIAATGIDGFVKHDWIGIAVAVSYPIAAEGLFRGVVHGTLARRFRTQHAGGPWFLSWPVVISSALYALSTSLPFLPFFSRGVGLTFAAALVFGICSGIARERSESLLPCVVLHGACLVMLVAMFSFW